MRSCHETDGGRPDTMTRNSDRRRSRGGGARTDVRAGDPYLRAAGIRISVREDSSSHA